MQSMSLKQIRIIFFGGREATTGNASAIRSYPFTWYVMVFKKVSVICDRYPSFATLINRISLFPPTFTINIAEAAKAHYFYHAFFFENGKTRNILLSSAYIHLGVDVTIWSVTKVWQSMTFASKYSSLSDGPLEKLWGGRGIFEPQEFFFVIKFLVWIFFRPLHEYFLGLIGVQEFF